MSQLIVAGAGFDGTAVSVASLPHLSRWLAGSAPPVHTRVSEDALHLPHEHAHAKALGWSTAPSWPWAALQTQTLGQPCAWLHLTHWQAGMNQITLLSPVALALTADESQLLGSDLADWLRGDGLQLESVATAPPGTYLLRAPWLADLPSLSWRRAAGQALRRDELRDLGVLPDALARLQSEIEMWLYAHPLVEARLAARQLAPNGIWIDGAGPLDAMPTADVIVNTDLLDVAVAGDVRRHAEIWAQVDAHVIAPWLERFERGEPITLTLAGSRGHASFAPQMAPSLWSRATRLFRAAPPFELNTL